MNEMCCWCMCVDHNAVPHRCHLHNFMQTLMCVCYFQFKEIKGIEAYELFVLKHSKPATTSVDTSAKKCSERLAQCRSWWNTEHREMCEWHPKHQSDEIRYHAHTLTNNGHMYILQYRGTRALATLFFTRVFCFILKRFIFFRDRIVCLALLFFFPTLRFGAKPLKYHL